MNIRDQLERYAIGKNLGGNRSKQVVAPASRVECERTVTLFPRHHRHGSFELGSLAGAFPNAAAMLVRGEIGTTLEFERIAFVDTETTGLSGGSGVCAFLVGIGYLTPDGFAVEQFLMNDFPAEPDMLRRVCERLEQFDTIASYNGRAFDMPVLDARLVLNGLRKSLSDFPHLDFLHPARRLWKHRLRDCSLKSVEERAVGYARDNDIESWAIPEMFFRYLSSGERDLIEPILRHNRLDLVSLACLARLILGALDSPYEAPLIHGADWYGLGTVFAHHSRMGEAAHCFERALKAGAPDDVLRRCTQSLSLTHKKRGAWEDAVGIWKESLAAGEGASVLFALEELAKFYEHRQSDLVSAREVCKRAISMLEIREAVGCANVTRQFEGFEHRLKRIEKKIQSRRNG